MVSSDAYVELKLTAKERGSFAKVGLKKSKVATVVQKVLNPLLIANLAHGLTGQIAHHLVVKGNTGALVKWLLRLQMVVSLAMLLSRRFINAKSKHVLSRRDLGRVYGEIGCRGVPVTNAAAK